MHLSPILYSWLLFLFGFEKWAWEIFASIRLSRASAISFWRFVITSRAEMCASEGLGTELINGGMIRGDRPKRRWKGEYPVDLFTVLMMWKRIRGKALTHPFWFRSTWNLRHWLTVLLVRSLTPLDWGWKLEEALHVIPVSMLRCFQKADMKSLSRSETMSKGKPFSQYQLSKNRTASSLAVSVVVVGMMRTSDEVFAVRRVFWAESDQNWSDPLRSDQNPLRIFLTPNGRDMAKFFWADSDQKHQFWADLSRSEQT